MEVDRLTIPEYELLMEAERLKQVDEQYKIHLQAWLTVAAKATNRSGKPVFKKFERFFNYRKELKKARNPEHEKVKYSGIGKYL